MRQAGVGHCQSGTVQLLQVREPADLSHQHVRASIVQVDEDDIAEVVDANAIDQRPWPPRLPGRRGLPSSQSVSYRTQPPAW